MKDIEEKFLKLPKWAQDELRRRDNEIRSLSERLDQFNGTSDTNTFLVEGLEKRPLPKNAQIEINTGKGKVNVYLRRDGNVDVNTHDNYGEEMVIIPRASNSFYINFAKP